MKNLVAQIQIEEFLQYYREVPVIDVRSPKEYEHAHIPGAINLPVFTDDERALVGITYKKKGKENAIILGLEIVGPKLTQFAKYAKKIAVNNKLLVHCWRGGMRSSNMAWLFDTLGIETNILKGGYKAYRRYLKSYFSKKTKLIILGGMTGSGKTEILKCINEKKYQVADLENLAHHKGSAFGALGEKKQDSTEQFENNLFEIWKDFKLNDFIWIEDESQAIGKNRVPEELYVQMRKSPVIKVNIPKQKRATWLLQEYGGFDQEELKNSLLKIEKKLGGLNTKIALKAIEENNLNTVADITLSYYDKAYNFGLSKRNGQKIYEIELNEVNHELNANKILEYFQELNL